MSNKNTLPLIPLRDTVLFPSMSLPIIVGREKSVAALKDALNRERQVILATQKSADIEDPQERDLYNVGVLARVIDISPEDQKPIQAYVEITERVKITDYALTEPYLEVQFELQPSLPIDDSPEVEALLRNV